MSDEDSIPELTNEFVSKLIGKKVQSFTIKAGTAPGDNYMSVLYCLKCVLAPEKENDIVSVVYGIAKCYPAHPIRQQFLNKVNIFWNELHVYQDWVPALKNMVAQNGTEMSFPFAPIISGESPNFATGKENDEMLKKFEGKVFNPFDIFILMVDMKNTFEFRMADRLIGLGLEEMNLVMQEYAKVHALSWAYKCKHGIDDLSLKFPCFKLDMKEEGMEIWRNLMNESLQGAYDTLSGLVTPQESGILSGLSKTQEKRKEIMDFIFLPGPGVSGSKLEALLRVPMDIMDEERKADDVPWKVVIHGDCWVNNLLFRYDPLTKKVVELVLIDMQLTREACPTFDLAHIIYSSTSLQLRQKHLKDWLHLYSDQFMFHCDTLGVPYLPGFCFESLMRRFHRSKILGITMGMIVLPVMLKQGKDVQDLDNCKEDMDLGEMFVSIFGSSEDNLKYKRRVYALCKEMYEDGVI